MALNYTLPQLLKTLMEQKGSDLHISAESAPRMRLDGHLLAVELPPLTSIDTKDLCYSVLTQEQQQKFEAEKELDFSFAIKGVSRFRGNVYLQKGNVSGVFRVIPFKVKSLTDLNLPPIIEQLCQLPRGLILVTGPTGSGKSTTLAAMVNYINENRNDHIVTMEDPIEFVHSHKNCLINQREIGTDTDSFRRALKSVLRQDPDVVLVGELRDLETISLAITTAETGHLVFGTLHTNSCVSTLSRLIDVFPPEQQLQIRSQLSGNLMACISQLLLPAVTTGRAMSMEIMIPNNAIRNLIREDKFHQIYSAMQTGQGTSGMQTMNQSLYNLIEKKQITPEVALQKSSVPEELQTMLTRSRPSTIASGTRGA